MSGPQGILSLVTLGVANLKRSIAFYETLGFRRKAHAADGVGFFQAGACAIAVFPSVELTKDGNVAFEGMAENFRGVALAWNCRSQDAVDAVIDRAGRAGAISTSRRRTLSGAATAAISPISTTIFGRWPIIRIFR